MAAPRKKRADGPLVAIRERIKEAEKKARPIGRENVGVDGEGYETLAVLIERGLGAKTEVLRQALAAGLRALKASSEPERDYSVDVADNVIVDREPPFEVESALEIGAPIITPPSVLRREAGEFEEDEDRSE